MFQLDSMAKLLRVKNWENDKRQSRRVCGVGPLSDVRGARQEESSREKRMRCGLRECKAQE